MPPLTQSDSDHTSLSVDKQSQLDFSLSVEQATADWDRWVSGQTSRKRFPLLRKLASPNALYWGMSASAVIHHATTARLVQLKKSSTATEFDWTLALEEWHDDIRANPNVAVAVDSLAWAHALPLLVKPLSKPDWQGLLVSLHKLTQTTAQDCPIIQSLLTVELPMTLAYGLRDLAFCHALRKPARSNFASILDVVLDGEGMPQGRFVGSIQLLLASCTRTLMLDAQLKKGRVAKAARLQFDWLCRQTLRWARPDGSTMLQANASSPHFDELMKYALKLTEDDSDVMSFRTLRGKRKARPTDDMAPCSEHSEWSELATMRTSWDANAARLAVNYSNRQCEIELAVGSEVVWNGCCLPKISVDDEPLPIKSNWEEVCWESDDDMDYIELECQLHVDWRIQRQILLAREDKFLFLADALVGEQTGEVQYIHTLPLADGVVAEQPDENTEVTLLGERRLGRIVPLAFPEWKSQLNGQVFRLDPARYETKSRTHAIYAPLFVDLDPSRLQKAITWRQLTVAENLQTVGKETAVAYRIQIGKRQWIFYRSLARTANRTFLGQNLISEFLAARFTPSGKAETLIDIAG